MNKLFHTLYLTFIAVSAMAQPDWVYSIEQARAIAINEKKLLLVDFTASWCGPCRKMDQQVWPDRIVDSLSDKFVSVKIDITSDMNSVKEFNITSIPRVMILDITKDRLEELTGYQTASSLSNKMSEYPANVNIVNTALIPVLSDSENFIAQHEAGVAYGKYISALNGDAKDRFADMSNTHFEIAEKYAKKENSKVYQEKALLGRAMNSANLGDHKKAVRMVEKYGLEDFETVNLTHVYYVLGYSAKINDKEEEFTAYLKTLENIEGGSYLARLLKND